MSRILFRAVCLLAWAVAAGAESVPTAPTAGIDLKLMDQRVRPQDDFYRYCNGRWLDTTAIPADKSSYGPTDDVQDRVQQQLHDIIAALQPQVPAVDAEQRKIADLYASFMDEAQLERLGLEPLSAEFARIEALRDVAGIPGLVAHLNRIGVSVPYSLQVQQDAKDASKYAIELAQDGIGIPDRDYYLRADADLIKVRRAYAAHVARTLALSADPHAAADARAIVRMETALAKLQWTKVASQDPVKAYNRYSIASLAQLTPGYHWTAYLEANGIAGKTDYLIVRQPSYLRGFARLLRNTPLPVWRAYFRWRVLSDFSPYLNRALAEEHFAFYGTALLGTERDRVRWKRGVELVDRLLGEALGRLYVAQYFPPEAKARMQELVGHLIEAYRLEIESLDWMGPQTRVKALAKLSKFTAKIGYPDRWRDYSAVVIVRDDLVGNVARAQAFEYDRNLGKLGHPIDRGEWDMTPPTVNAYYSPGRNEIVFPAGMLQPPFFDLRADDAANYAGIVSVIGHEISHGFDDYGSQYDGDGNLLSPPGWFTHADLSRFKARTRALVAQYAGYAPVPGYPINGELTLGENIADNAGLAIAYKAYLLSLNGRPAPLLDGFSGSQRYFIAFTQTSRGQVRDSAAILNIKSEPHSPDQFRALIPVLNEPAFYESFDVKPGDKMYVEPARRVQVW